MSSSQKLNAKSISTLMKFTSLDPYPFTSHEIYISLDPYTTKF